MRVYQFVIEGDKPHSQPIIANTPSEAIKFLDDKDFPGGFWKLIDMSSPIPDDVVAWAQCVDSDTDVFWEFGEDYRFEDD